MGGEALGCRDCPVRDRAACAALSPEERDELAAAGRIRTLARGETLFAAGDDADLCATLVSGALKITAFDQDGGERILALVHPAGFVGELFTPFARHDVVALTESRLCLFSRSEFEAASARFPSLGLALHRRAQEDLHESRALLDLVGRRSAEARVAGLLLALANAASGSPCHPARHFELPLSRGDMAGMLGLTIESVSRQLTSLERKSIVKRDGARGLDVLEPALLAAAAA